MNKRYKSTYKTRRENAKKALEEAKLTLVKIILEINELKQKKQKAIDEIGYWEDILR